MQMLVVRLQHSWDKMVNFRHATFPVKSSKGDSYLIDNQDSFLPFLVEHEEIKKSAIGKAIYNEMFVKTENGTYWGFDVKICTIIDEGNISELDKVVRECKNRLCTVAKKELRSRNSTIKEAFKAVETFSA